MDLWVLVVNKIATWSELNEFWSLEDVAKANAVLSITKTIENISVKQEE